MLVDENNVKHETKRQRKERAEAEKRRVRRWFILADIAAILFWSYVLVRLFVVDVNRLVIEAIDPDLLGLLDYQILFYLVVASLVLFSLRRRSAYLWALYVIGFPAVVLVWKIPKAIYKRKSWIVTVAALNAAVATVHSFKFYFTLYTIGLISVTLVVVSGIRSVTIAATAAVAFVTVVLIYRIVRSSFQKNRFVEMHRSEVVKGVRGLHSFVGLQPELRDPSIQKFNKAQLELIRDRLSIGLLVTKATSFWVHQLSTYRKTGLPNFFAILSYVGLLFQVLFGATFVNYGIVRAFDGSFQFDQFPSIVEVLHYTMNALAINSVDGLKPVSDLALIVKIALGLLGPTILATLVAYVVLNHKLTKQELDFQSMANDINDATKSLEQRMSRDYEVTLDEAFVRVAQMGGSLYVGILTFLMDQLPKEPAGE
ncbi:hypothetical protein [Saccharothrix luteola]|uniref:hypothetical protein n=1 Tax=Saccharothrix luteola TaxID=2893018 RepID=UPI001E31AD4E|nr:hypothetical protein [Saccharothrix luteola]MCC8243867.1 hypothetical protein [Saccharothrix luteola]